MTLLPLRALAVLAALFIAVPAFAQAVRAGEGSYHLGPKGRDKGLPAAPFRTEAMLKRAAPTNQWYSTLIFDGTPAPIYVQPLTVQTTADGFEMSLPRKVVTTTERRDTVAYSANAAQPR